MLSILPDGNEHRNFFFCIIIIISRFFSVFNITIILPIWMLWIFVCKIDFLYFFLFRFLYIPPFTLLPFYLYNVDYMDGCLIKRYGMPLFFRIFFFEGVGYVLRDRRFIWGYWERCMFSISLMTTEWQGKHPSNVRVYERKCLSMIGCNKILKLI